MEYASPTLVESEKGIMQCIKRKFGDFVETTSHHFLSYFKHPALSKTDKICKVSSKETTSPEIHLSIKLNNYFQLFYLNRSLQVCQLNIDHHYEFHKYRLTTDHLSCVNIRFLLFAYSFFNILELSYMRTLSAEQTNRFYHRFWRPPFHDNLSAMHDSDPSNFLPFHFAE